MAKNKGGNAGGNTASRGIDNLTYNIVTLLHEKAKGLEAFEQYEKDAKGHDEIIELLQNLRSRQEEDVQELNQCLQELYGGGEMMDEEEDEEAA